MEDDGTGMSADPDCTDCSDPPKQACADGYTMTANKQDGGCTAITCTTSVSHRFKWASPITGSIAKHNMHCSQNIYSVEDCKSWCECTPGCQSIEYENGSTHCCLNDCRIGDGDSDCSNDNDQDYKYYELEGITEENDENDEWYPTCCAWDYSNDVCNELPLAGDAKMVKGNLEKTRAQCDKEDAQCGKGKEEL